VKARHCIGVSIATVCSAKVPRRAYAYLLADLNGLVQRNVSERERYKNISTKIHINC